MDLDMQIGNSHEKSWLLPYVMHQSFEFPEGGGGGKWPGDDGLITFSIVHQNTAPQGGDINN